MSNPLEGKNIINLSQEKKIREEKEMRRIENEHQSVSVTKETKEIVEVVLDKSDQNTFTKMLILYPGKAEWFGIKDYLERHNEFEAEIGVIFKNEHNYYDDNELSSIRKAVTLTKELRSLNAQRSERDLDSEKEVQLMLLEASTIKDRFKKSSESAKDNTIDTKTKIRILESTKESFKKLKANYGNIQQKELYSFMDEEFPRLDLLQQEADDAVNSIGQNIAHFSQATENPEPSAFSNEREWHEKMFEHASAWQEILEAFPFVYIQERPTLAPGFSETDAARWVKAVREQIIPTQRALTILKTDPVYKEKYAAQLSEIETRVSNASNILEEVKGMF